MMNDLKKLVAFLEILEIKAIHFNLQKTRNSIMINVAVSGQRWEIEFMDDGRIEIEKFLSDGMVFDENEIEVLFRDFSD